MDGFYGLENYASIKYKKNLMGKDGKKNKTINNNMECKNEEKGALIHQKKKKNEENKEDID